jgi:2-polyprenyl-3-methyl-5-hydroxy-6-metoxy-1,4-benzoquinol methylase
MPSELDCPRPAPRTARVGACPLCESDQATVLFTACDRLFDTPGEFTYRSCTICSTVFQDPRVIPEDLHLCYPSSYRTHALPEELPPPQSLGALREAVRRSVVAAVLGQPFAGRMGKLGSLLAKSRSLRHRAFFFAPLKELQISPSGSRRALDIGCGVGVLLRDLAERGWKAEGVEWDAATAALAEQVSGCNVKAGDFREVELPKGSYDLIVLHHVLEHLDRPKAALKRIADLLAPGGTAVLIYPNPRSWAARRFGAHWFSWDAPRHLVIPPPEALADAASESGLRVSAVRTSSRTSLMVVANSRAYSQARRANSAGPALRDRLQAAAERILTTFGKPLGEEVVVVLRKSS